MRKLLLMFFLVISALTVYAQGDRMLSGKITDEKGRPVVGATITVKANRQIGASTDVNGNYRFRLPNN